MSLDGIVSGRWKKHAMPWIRMKIFTTRMAALPSSHWAIQLTITSEIAILFIKGGDSMSTPVAFIFVCTILFGPFFLIDYKHWRNARAAEKIFHEAKPKFIQECKRLGIRADLEFCDLYTSSFIRCDHVTERIAVYAGKTNRFAIIPYKDYFMMWSGPKVGGTIPAGNDHYVTTQIGNTSVTTEYKSQSGFYIGGYTPKNVYMFYPRGVRMCKRIYF